VTAAAHAMALPPRDGSAGTRDALPAAARRIRVGMPHLDAAGLSEGWLLRHTGDLHWEAIARRLEVRTDEIRSQAGKRLYPTVVAVRARYSAPPTAVAENDVLEAAVEVVPCGRACAHGRVVWGASGGRRFALELLTTFAAREREDDGEGAMRMTPPEARLAQRWTAIGAAPDIARLARAARRAEPVDDPLLGPILTRASAGAAPIAALPHEPSPYADYNGAGLLYFASYVGIADTGERRLVRGLGLAPRRMRGLDWALAASPVRRDVFYYENLPLGASLTVDLMAFDEDERGVTTHVRLRRDDHDGGRPMGDVITRRLFRDGGAAAPGARRGPCARP